MFSCSSSELTASVPNTPADRTCAVTESDSFGGATAARTAEQRRGRPPRQTRSPICAHRCGHGDAEHPGGAARPEPSNGEAHHACGNGRPALGVRVARMRACAKRTAGRMCVPWRSRKLVARCGPPMTTRSRNVVVCGAQFGERRSVRHAAAAAGEVREGCAKAVSDTSAAGVRAKCRRGRRPTSVFPAAATPQRAAQSTIGSGSRPPR